MNVTRLEHRLQDIVKKKNTKAQKIWVVVPDEEGNNHWLELNSVEETTFHETDGTYHVVLFVAESVKRLEKKENNT